jgi:hypothetical protein
MKKELNPAIAAVVVIIVLVVAVFFFWKGAGPRTDGPSQPIDMGKMMNKDKMAPPTNMAKPGMMGTQNR